MEVDSATLQERYDAATKLAETDADAAVAEFRAIIDDGTVHVVLFAAAPARCTDRPPLAQHPPATLPTA